MICFRYNVLSVTRDRLMFFLRVFLFPSTIKRYRHDLTEIIYEVAFKTNQTPIKMTLPSFFNNIHIVYYDNYLSLQTMSTRYAWGWLRKVNTWNTNIKTRRMRNVKPNKNIVKIKYAKTLHENNTVSTIYLASCMYIYGTTFAKRFFLFFYLPYYTVPQFISPEIS